jgi:glycosyltransferase involved in cell wall biosynthesis
LNAYSNLDLTIISSPPELTINSKRKLLVKHIPIKINRKINFYDDFISFWEIYKLFEREKFDVVHSHTAKAGFITTLAAGLARVPKVYHTYHGLPFYNHQNRALNSFYYILEKIACKFRNAVFTQNKSDYQSCVQLIGSKKNAFIEGNGVDIQFVNYEAENQFSRGESAFLTQGFKICLLSRLEPVKRVTNFFEVIKNLKNRGIDTCCVMAGTGILEKSLKNRLKNMNLEYYINMIGFCDYPFGLIKACDLVMLCSEKEGIPRSLMEAMALRKPVVATNVKGTNELVVNEETGFLVPLGDIEAMTEKVVALIKNKDLREKFGENGFMRVTEHFNEQKIVEFLYNFYLEAP